MSTIVIVGSAGDIGQCLVKRFLARGAQVFGFDIEEQRPRDHFVPVQVDITDSASVADGFGLVGTVDVLINNAGGISAHSLQTTNEATWERDIDLNLTGVWRCMNAVMPSMIARQTGAIVNTASVNGMGVYGHPGYSVAKAGLIHLTKFAAVELGQHGIRVLAVAPGTVRTRAWKDRIARQPDIIEDALKWYPSRAISEASEVAQVIEFAALDAPNTMTGTVLTVDGGLTAGHDMVAAAFCGEN